ncbi:MAG: cytochrome C oxidase assembly protein [Rhodobacteraceae bacterium]|nr:cytochrome C oxidase assembly protein [Paracoccaceae bacterium]
MLPSRDHSIHPARRSRNRAVALLLGGFVLLVFLITIVKLQNGQTLEAFDHVLRPSLLTDE